MKKVLPNTKKNRDKLDAMPKMYMVACWARYGVQSFPFSGKYTKGECGEDIPLVWQYDDHNGTCNHFYLRPITLTTTGWIKVWTPYKSVALQIADFYNKFEKN